MASSTTIPHYKLYYFGLRGRGECVRYIFAAASVPYEEELIDFQSWANIKNTFKPFHQLPVLEIDRGKERIGQHIAICRFLAKRFGLAGKDGLEQAKADMYVDGASDLWGALNPLFPHFIAGDMEKWNAGILKFIDETLKPWLTLYTGFLEENPTKSGWLVGDRLTWADLYVTEFLNRIQVWNKEAMTDHPKMQQLCDRVHSIPEIANRVQSRPKDWPPG